MIIILKNKLRGNLLLSSVPILRLRARAAIASLCVLPCTLLHAQTPPSDGKPNADGADSPALPAVHVAADAAAAAGFNPVAAPKVNKSSVPLAETPQSITVVPRTVLDSEQAQTLADALHNVPGVVANQYGRRGWDDLIIRGQVASDSLYLDGLRTSASNRVAEQLFGVQQVEVLKGPASLLYGLVLPGRLVNMVSKRPKPEASAALDVTVGSYGLRQASVDMGTPLSQNGKAALRINALAMNSDDATDHVWFRNRYIAPSLSLDLGPRTDFTLLASYQERSYIRQQGLPLAGSVLPNPNGAIDRHRFIGEPGQDPYHGYESRIGYAFSHRFDNGWTVNQNFRYQEFSLNGLLIANNSFSRNQRTLSRTVTRQHYDGDTISLDTNAQKTFATTLGKHELTVGMDYLRSREDALSYNCSIAALNVYAPVYGASVSCPAKARTHTDTTVRSVGIYLRDQIALGERWRLVAGLRHDNAASYGEDRLAGSRNDNSASALTGSAALMYELWPGIRPYLSFATSFYPNSGTDVNGKTFDPERGRQWEAGVKFDVLDNTSLTLAAFDLRRRNVLESDPLNTDYDIAVGEQRTRGLELGFVSDFANGLSLTGGYAYTAAVITKDGGQASSSVGQRLDNVPRHSFNVFARYRPSTWQGWEINGGLRGEGERYAYGYSIPGYALADIGVAYDARRWRAALTVRNLFDKAYFAGGLSKAIALGDERTVMLTLGYRY